MPERLRITSQIDGNSMPSRMSSRCDSASSIVLPAKAVLMKGGHLSAADSPDWLVQESGTLRLGGPRVPVKNTHGTGCTLSSAIAALIPQRDDLASAVADAKQYLTGALQASERLDVGKGVGPVHHFYRWW